MINYTKSQLKELIAEVAAEQSLSLSSEKALPFLNENLGGLSDIDEEERAEWKSMIEDDALALRSTLINAPEEVLSAEHQEILSLLNRLEGGEDEEPEDDYDDEDW